MDAISIFGQVHSRQMAVQSVAIFRMEFTGISLLCMSALRFRVAPGLLVVLIPAKSIGTSAVFDAWETHLKRKSKK